MKRDGRHAMHGRCRRGVMLLDTPRAVFTCSAATVFVSVSLRLEMERECWGEVKRCSGSGHSPIMGPWARMRRRSMHGAEKCWMSARLRVDDTAGGVRSRQCTVPHHLGQGVLHTDATAAWKVVEPLHGRVQERRRQRHGDESMGMPAWLRNAGSSAGKCLLRRGAEAKGAHLELCPAGILCRRKLGGLRATAAPRSDLAGPTCGRRVLHGYTLGAGGEGGGGGGVYPWGEAEGA